MTQSARAELALVGVTVVWGASFTVVQSALADASVWAFLAMRFTLASVILAAAGGIGAPQSGIVPGLFLAAGYFFQTSGLLHTTPSKSAFITAISIVLVPLGAMLVYRIRPGANEALGVLMAMLGMGLMAIPHGGLAPGSMNRGDLLTAGGAVAYAGHIISVGHWARRANPAKFIFIQTAGVAALSWSACAAFGFGPVRWSWRLVGALAFTAVACTALAYWVQAWAQRRTSATRTAIIFALEPVAAAITSYMVSGEVLAQRAAWGAFLIVCGILAAELKPPPRQGHLVL